MKTYSQFWPFYLDQHRASLTQRLHGLGTLLGIGCVLLVVPVSRNAAWLWTGLAIAYFFAWVSHGIVERNKPATFLHPYWSFFGDMEMLTLMLVGRLEQEVRIQSQEAPPRPSARRVAWRWLVRLVITGWFVMVFALQYLGVFDFRWLFPILRP